MAAFDADAREHAVGGHCIVGDLVEASAHFREFSYVDRRSELGRVVAFAKRD